ncbi:AAA domain-containing protein [Trinickia mobilis]|uniref:AAA domain-containing protein n=1 Tax=Trinickia mobilis TaxID=2816356 RepID=UPI001A8D3909|nr:AAA domain-containing protein [Trinickia mobilis]
MKITFLSPTGVLPVEQAAFREIERRLPETWAGFAAFQLAVHNGNPLDIDLLVLTNNRILVVELKNWKGEITSANGQWLVDGKLRGRSPIDVSVDKARKLPGFLKSKLPSDAVPYAEAMVVLCHPNGVLNLPDDERKYAMTLHEFVDVMSDSKLYEARYSTIRPDKRIAPNPLLSLSQYRLLFAPGSKYIKQLRFTIQSYVQSTDQPEFRHPNGLFEEFYAAHKESTASKALMRRWDFNRLDGGNTSPAQRVNIALRETRLNEFVRHQSDELHRSLLEPIGSPSAEDVTTNFAELYRLRPNHERLDEYLARRRERMTPDERINLVQAMLNRYSRLHALGIAHRDIGSHSLWIEEPVSVTLSGFAAAHYREQQTVGEHRPSVEGGVLQLPEDETGEVSEPFARDVYMLGIAARKILALATDGATGPNADAVSPEGDESSLKSWFDTALAPNPMHRFETAEVALREFNKLVGRSSKFVVLEDDFAPYRTDASPSTYPMSEQVSMDTGKWVYRSNDGERSLLVKIWTGLRFDAKRPSVNERILAFLEKARAMKMAPCEDYPEVREFGFGPLGLTLVCNWIQGVTFADFCEKEKNAESRAQAALALLRLVSRVHTSGLFHGDLKPENVVWASDENGKHATLIDILDLQSDGDTGLTPAYSPAGDASPLHRDLHAAVLMCGELLAPCGVEFNDTKKDIRNALELSDSEGTLAVLIESLERSLAPPSLTPLDYVVSCTERPSRLLGDEFPSDNGRFQVGLERPKDDSKTVIFHIIGVVHHIRITVDGESQKVMGIHIREQGHADYVRNVARADFQVELSIRWQWSVSEDALSLARNLFSLASSGGLLGKPAPDHTLEPQPASDAPVTTRQLWHAVSRSEVESAVIVTIRPGAEYDPSDPSRLLVPYEVDGGVPDFGKDEEVKVLAKLYDPSLGETRWRPVGSLNVELSTAARLAIEHTSIRFSVEPGSEYRLRGRLDEIALGRRQAAIQRILSDKALISKLPEYFDPAVSVEPTVSPIPAGADLGQYGLNEEQLDALKTVLTLGPVSFLQGPPGTGKTKFIAAAIHCLLSNNLARNVLLVSQSHEAINHALSKVSELAKTTDADLSMVRVGQENMLSDEVRHLHDLGQQSVYRERFSAELPTRIGAAADSLGLSQQYVQDAIRLHLGLGRLAAQLRALSPPGAESSAEAVEEYGKRWTTLLETFREVAAREFGDTSRGRDFEQVYSAIEEQLAERHAVASPANRERLKNLVELSEEFERVLGNPRANYTAFLARSRQVVAGTCVGIGRHALGIVDHAYDWVIVDEAARSSPTELAVAMQAGRRVLLVGDQNQLPPTYTPDFEREMAAQLGRPNTSMHAFNDFARAFKSPYGKQTGRTLLTQYRMTPTIGDLISNCFYDRKLQHGRTDVEHSYHFLPSYIRHELTWLDTSDQGADAYEQRVQGSESLLNESEAGAILKLLQRVATSVEREPETISEEISIGVICMYAGQRDLLQDRFSSADWASPIRNLVRIGTVDSYQGKENSIILLSLVRNNHERQDGFLRWPERVNVALSRAMDRLIIVGACSMWLNREESALGTVLKEMRAFREEGRASIIPSLGLEEVAV